MQIGEVRSAMSHDLLSKKLYGIAKQAHDDKRLDEFWILLSHKVDIFLSNIIREAVVVTNKRPPKMINSMCFHIVWSRGLIESEWMLPMDTVYDIPELAGSDGHSSLVYDSVRDMAFAI